MTSQWRYRVRSNLKVANISENIGQNQKSENIAKMFQISEFLFGL